MHPRLRCNYRYGVTVVGRIREWPLTSGCCHPCVSIVPPSAIAGRVSHRRSHVLVLALPDGDGQRPQATCVEAAAFATCARAVLSATMTAT